MSETKRGAQAPKGPRKRTRSKRTESVVVPDSEIDDNVGNETTEETAVSSDDRQLLQSELAAQRPLPTEDDDDAPSENFGNEEPRSKATPPRSETPASNQGNAPKEDPGPRFKPSDEYLTQIYFDRAARQFVGTVHEFPEVRVNGTQRAQVLSDTERKLEQHLLALRGKGTNTPQPVSTRKYPDKLELPISQGLFRKLDLLSRQEKIPLEGLVAEILASAVEKRYESPGPAQKQHSHGHQENRDRHHDRNQHQDRRPHNNNNPNQGSPGNSRRPNNNNNNNNNRRGGQGRSYHDTMDNRENFLEYVRSLEKGGTGNRWKK